MSSSQLSVSVLGGSGATGKAVIKALAKEDKIKTVTLILRKTLDLEKLHIDQSYLSKFNQQIINFDKLDEYSNTVFGTNYDACICCLGTTRGKSGKDGFYKVDHDYIINTAKMMIPTEKGGGDCKHYNLVSSRGAKANSWFYYLQVKGQVEEKIANLGFSRVSIYRPAFLLTEREESRPAESFARTFLKCFDRWNVMSTPIDVLANAIVKNIISSSDKQVQILENNDILKIDSAVV